MMMADMIFRRSYKALSVRTLLTSLAAAMLFATVTPHAHAVLLHEWTFNNGNANDSVGTSHGTLNGNAEVVAGQVVLDGSANTTVTFPAAALAVNAYPAITLEAWATPSSAQTGFTTLFGFGSVSSVDPNFAANYFILQSHRGDNVSRAAISIADDADPFNNEDFANGPEYNDNLKHHYAAVLTNTSISLYTDGQLRQTTTVPVNGVNNMISGIGTGFAGIGMGYPIDPLYTGTVGNIRLYNEARTALQVLLAFNAGEPGPQGPRLTIDRATGAMTLSNAQTASNIVGYSITSAAGSLNSAAWQSNADLRDANNAGSFDADDVWTELSAAGSKTDFSEFELEGGNGGAFGAGGTQSLPIGAAGAWRKSIYEDVQVQMRLADGSALPVQIVYSGGIGNVPYIRSDLNFSGNIDVNDWNIFKANSGASFSTLTRSESYALGDINGDLISDRIDFRIFKGDYNAVNGAGAFESMSGVVPEPSTLALFAVAAAGCWPRKRRNTVAVPAAVSPNAASCPRFAARSVAAVLAVVVIGIASTAHAAIKHRYGFNEGVIGDASNRTIIDSVSAANGVVRGAGSSATAGQLNLVGGASATAAYVDLPNGIISSLTNATFEAWYSITPNPAMPTQAQSWGRIFDFGSTDSASTNGELTAPGGGGNGQDFLFYAPARGTDIATQRVGFGNQDPLFGGSAGGPSATGVYFDYDPEFPHQFNQMHHVAVVVNANGAGAGMATVATYIDGALTVDAGGGANPNPVDYQLANLNDVNNWLGRSNWTVDANFGGAFQEFRVYDHAMTNSEVATDFICGPDLLCANAVSLEVNKSNGQVKLKNNLSVPLPIEYYEITSAGGALSTAGWTSIDGDAPAPGAGWDKSGAASANKLIELYLPETDFMFAANGELTLGAAFNPAIFGAGQNGDLQFTLGHRAGAELTGTVTYVTSGGVAGDYNSDGKVNAADYTYWRDRLGQNSPLPNTNPADGDGVVTQAEYTYWKSRFNAMSGSGAVGSAAVPEPATWLLATCIAGGTLLLNSRRRTGKSPIQRSETMNRTSYANLARALAALLVVVVTTSAASAATKDRFYRFGDDVTEHPSIGAAPNTDFGSFTGDSAAIIGTDYQDLVPAGGGPVYVRTDSTSRPGAAATEWGLNFDGVDDRLFITTGGLGSPATGDNQASYAGLSYTNITTRLMDGWVRPTNAALGRQDVINDTNQFGIYISADDKWGLVEGTAVVTSTTNVAFNAWTHVMHRTYTNDAGSLYVNGVVVAATGNNYNAAPPNAAPNLDIVVGAGINQASNFFQGHLDDFNIWVSGNNTGQAGGRDYGAVNIATENEYIRQQLIGKQLGDVNLSGGAPNATDVSIFVANWLKVRQVNGVNVGGDLTSRAVGDFNLNGVVDIDDAYTLHAGLAAAGAGGLDFSLLGSNVPEPGTLLVVLTALPWLALRRRRSV